MRWTALVGAGLHAKVASRARKLADRRRWARASGRIQIEQMTELLREAAGTRFGRAHDFARIAEISDPRDRVAAYRSTVPIADWYAFVDDIRDMREGGVPDVLWPGLVKHFAQTSGTTAGDKFIPLSQPMFRSNYRASLDIFAHMLNRGVSLTRVMSGRCLFLGGSSDLSYNEHGVATGDLSGLVTPLIKWPLSAIYSPGPKIALMDDWPAKIEAMAELTSRQDIRFISGMPSWALVLMNRVMKMAGASCVREVWPNLEVFVHGGVRYDPFGARIARAYSGDPNIDIPERLELYPASEAFVAIQDDRAEPYLRLLVDNGVFFEFVPREQIDDPNPEAFGCWEVEPGQQYVVVLTTCAGLWRYVLGDVVEFHEVPTLDGSGGPARLRIVGRHRHFINAFGENLIAEHIEDGVTAACAATGLVVGEFTAAPVYPDADGGRRAGLELAVEFERPPTEPELAAFTEAFDEGVKAVNVDYTTKRTAGLGMGEPTVTPLAMGTFHRWLEAKGKLGGQHKCPRCANTRETLESITSAGTP